MLELAKESCTPFRGSQSTLAESEITELYRQLPEWSMVERDGTKRLERTFRFRNFEGALSFTIKIGEIGEEEGHHPTLLTEWGRVTVTWWSRRIKGLHRNDFIMAAKTNQVYFLHMSRTPS